MHRSFAEEPGAHAATVKRPKAERRAAQRFEVVVLEGPDAGLRVALEGGGALVGTSALCTLRLTDPAALPKHCTLQVEREHVVLHTLATDATRVNGVVAREAFLTGGEVVRVGDSLFALSRIAQGARDDLPQRFGQVLGESDAMRALYAVLEGLAGARAPILLEGERGTGKRLLAEEIHRRGPDPSAPFVVCDRQVGPANALEAALFGRGGLLAQARSGTLYVAELHDLDITLQEMLASRIATSDVRLVVGTRGRARRRASDVVAPGLQRLLTETTVVIPPLRDRDDDVRTLARAFWTELGGGAPLPDDLLAPFAGHSWPGNVRELRAAVEHRLRHEASVPVGPLAPSSSRVSDAIGQVVARDLPFGQARRTILAEFERRYVDRALERAGHRTEQAAAASGVAYRYFQILKARRR